MTRSPAATTNDTGAVCAPRTFTQYGDGLHPSTSQISGHDRPHLIPAPGWIDSPATSIVPHATMPMLVTHASTPTQPSPPAMHASPRP